mgnify:FL=1
MNKLKGKKQSPEHIAKRVAKVIGRRNTPESIRRMSEAHKGLPSGRKGRHFPNEQGLHLPHCIDCGKEISYGHIRCAEDFVKHTWKGRNVHIETLHQWIKKNKPKPELCECCHIKPPYDCANISGEYLRDVNDYEWLCRRCHMLKDGRLEALKNRAGQTWEIHRSKYVIF